VARSMVVKSGFRMVLQDRPNQISFANIESQSVSGLAFNIGPA
jgi:hypothetical protein